MFDEDISYVLRLKGETKGHIFYEYEEGATMYCNVPHICTGKMKSACEFGTYKGAVEEKILVDKEDEFDIVSYLQAEEEYYGKQ